MRDKIIAVIFTLSILICGVYALAGEGSGISDVTKGLSYSEIPAAIDEDLPRQLPMRRTLVNVNGLFQKSIGRSFVEDEEADVYRMKNGQLIYSVDEMPEEALVWMADNVGGFAEDLEKKNIPLLYVQLPFKIRNGDNMMLAGCSEYANSNANCLVATMRDQDVNVLDLRDSISGLSSDYYSLFYNTDQHWTNGTALWAAGSISRTLKDDFGIKMKTDLLDPSKFGTKTYPAHFLGSFGKKTGAWYSGVDDYELITPAYETDFTFYADSEEGPITREGSFDKALLDKTNLEKNLFVNNTYETYTGGNYALTKVVNRRNTKGPHILLIRDSFSCSMMPFLALSCGELDAIDPRSFGESTIEEFAKKGRYDAVIIAYNPTIFGDTAFMFSE